MSILEEPIRGSVAPPGWSSPPPDFVAQPLPVVPASGKAGQAADAAVRWRARAARIDNAIVYGAYLAVCALLHWQVASVAHLMGAGAASVVYRFGMEARDGQTIGKRRYGIRVVAIDGGPAGPRAIAIRSLLRMVDSLPVCYVVGLLSMLRTGPGRRQRLGDVAAGTIVVAVDGRAARDGTAEWMLPAATVAAVIVSALTVLMIAAVPQQSLKSLSSPPASLSR